MGGEIRRCQGPRRPRENRVTRHGFHLQDSPRLESIQYPCFLKTGTPSGCQASVFLLETVVFNLMHIYNIYGAANLFKHLPAGFFQCLYPHGNVLCLHLARLNDGSQFVINTWGIDSFQCPKYPQRLPNSFSIQFDFSICEAELYTPEGTDPGRTQPLSHEGATGARWDPPPMAQIIVWPIWKNHEKPWKNHEKPWKNHEKP